jgi:G3E family GTPase
LNRRGGREADGDLGKERGTEMGRTKLVLIGGFLGAGKTTLLGQAAGLLARRGKRTGLLTNDQAPNLVDTALLKQQGFEVGEVAGGCFCCRFDQFVAAADRLVRDGWPEVILAEPVGSCTDLTATVIRPLEELQGDRFQVAPYSVMADPLRLREALAGSGAFQEEVRYVYRKQLEEADFILLNKRDLMSAGESAELTAQLAARHPAVRVFALSALRGEGVEEWLDAALAGAPAGARVAEVDYDTYAAGEAALGWLNATVRLAAAGGSDWPAFSRTLLNELQTQLRKAGAEVAHLKTFLSAPGLTVTAGWTANEAAPSIRERGACGHEAREAWLTINARVQMPPEELRAAVEASLGAAAGGGLKARVERLDCFRPSRPVPTHRAAGRK